MNRLANEDGKEVCVCVCVCVCEHFFITDRYINRWCVCVFVCVWGGGGRPVLSLASARSVARAQCVMTHEEVVWQHGIQSRPAAAEVCSPGCLSAL